jgi:signal transduction histidine kinase
LVVAVEDRGEGMPPDVARRAADPFFTTKPVGKGTGLGLSMVKGFAEQSGGRLLVESQPGRGTTVRIVLPRFQEHAAATG